MENQEHSNSFFPPKFLLKDVCPTIVNELVKYFEAKGAENIVSQLGKTMVAAQVLDGTPETFSFLAYPVPGLTRSQRESMELRDEEIVNVKLGKGNLRIDFDGFGQIVWFYVTDLPEMHTALQNALKA